MEAFMTNMIPPMMAPYLYAIGATVAALLTPLMLRFILAASRDTVANDSETAVIQPAAATKEQAWLLPCLFATMVIASAIACHHHQYWTQILINLTFTWLVIAEVFLETRLKIAIEPIITLGLGLALLASLDLHHPTASNKAILGACSGWLAASLIHLANTLLKADNNLHTFFHPILLAWLGAWLGPPMLLAAFISSMILNGLSLIVLKLSSTILMMRNKHIAMIELPPFNVWLVGTSWLIYYFLRDSA
jgi:hypothetical protein